MRFGLAVTVLPSGPKIHAGALRTIGVYNKSRCWGIWLPPDAVYDPSENPGLGLADGFKPHLLLSSIHPSSWPYVFRVQLRLAHFPGAMAYAAEVFKKSDINILFAECTESGFRHATWNVIGEALRIKEKTSNILGETQRDINPEHRKSNSARITEALLEELPEFVESLYEQNKKQKVPFLRARFATPRLCSYEEEFFDPQVWDKNKDRISRQVVYSVLPNLTFFFRHGLNILQPIRFQHNQDTGILFAEDHDKFHEALGDFALPVPTKAVASFDTDEHYVRLHLLNKEQMPRIFQINFNYTMRFRTPQSPDVKSSRGLIHGIACITKDENLNLFHMENGFIKQDKDLESGHVELLGEVGKNQPDISKARKTIESRLNGLSLPGFKVDACKIKALSLNKIFLSMHQKAPREQAVRKIICERAEEHGFEVVWCETDSETVTETVVQKMKECSGFIQILTSQSQEDRDVAWLAAEYFGAIALGMPSIRIVDESVRKQEEWRNLLKVAGDRPLLPFSLRDELEILNTYVDRLLDQLEGETVK
jgi:hypothetical protein